MSIHCSTAAGSTFDVTAMPGQTLAQAIWLSGRTPAPPLCSGLGHCGRCRVRFLSPAPAPLPAEEDILSPEELAAGWRLACRRQAADLPDCRILLPPPPARMSRILHAPLSGDAGAARPAPSALPPRRETMPAAGDTLLLAVDLGTTSLHWRAVTPQGSRVAEGHELNPQMGAGADVMSRLALARTARGAHTLALLVRRRLADIISGLPAPVTELCLAANTAMTDIFLGRHIEGLCAAPYRLSHTGGSMAQGLSVPGEQQEAVLLPPAYIPPLPAPFVGGDISAGMLAVLEDKHPAYPFLLADMGTNGEFALAVSPERTLVASVPLGPALEGIGLRLGDAAGPETAAAFRLTPQGLAAVTPSGLPARRICGTGYLSLLRLLLQTGLLDREGRFLHNPASPLARRLAAGLDRDRSLLRCCPPLFLTAGDVEELLKVKAAFSLAVEKLLHAAGLHAADLSAVYLAGALGEHVNPDDLEALGFLRPGQSARLLALGNTSLRGAELLLLRPELRQPLVRWRDTCVPLALAEDAGFTHDYLRHMRF